jgi:hypothetical protein
LRRRLCHLPPLGPDFYFAVAITVSDLEGVGYDRSNSFSAGRPARSVRTTCRASHFMV